VPSNGEEGIDAVDGVLIANARTFRRLAVFSIVVYLIVVFALFANIKRRNAGHFTYALDDPYIHLALAENIAHGHYGLNPQEYSSPSSSILWPILLVPFVSTKFHPYLPLLWNILFGSVAAALIAWTVDRYPPQQDEHGAMNWWKQAVTCVLLIFVANLPSLTLLGMEHTLQVLLAIGCAIGVIEALRGRPIPIWCLVAAVLSPAVRYEGLALTVAVCIALWGQRSWKKAAVVFGLSLAPLIAFSVFLREHGLPVLPMSVLVKGNVYQNPDTLRRIANMFKAGFSSAVSEPMRYAMVVFFFTFIGLAWSARTRERRFALWGVTLAAGAHLLIGRFGWFFRYEVYMLIFLTLVCMKILAEGRAFLFGFFALALTFVAAPFLYATRMTSAAASEVYYQQYQMHRFVAGFYNGNYAVNDIGWVSYQRTSGAYVLDVFGLASVEASQQRSKTAAWLDDVTRRHDVGLAMLYPTWFPHLPREWTPLASLCLQHPPIVEGAKCVMFYSTSPAENAEITGDLQRFALTMPKNSGFKLIVAGIAGTTREPGQLEGDSAGPSTWQTVP
jgi:hypothetical protein